MIDDLRDRESTEESEAMAQWRRFRAIVADVAKAQGEGDVKKCHDSFDAFLERHPNAEEREILLAELENDERETKEMARAFFRAIDDLVGQSMD